MRNFWTKRETPPPPDPQGRSADGQIYIGWDEKKKMNEATAKWTEAPKRRGFFSGLRGFIVTTLLLIGLLYGAIYVIGLMDGFRAFLEDHLKASLDIRVKLTKAWLTPSLNLEFEGLSTENFGRKGMPGLQIQRGKIEWTVTDETGWHLPKVRRAVVRGVSVHFAPDDYGRWEPAPLAAVGEKVADWCGFKVAAPKAEKPLPSLEKKTGEATKTPPDIAALLRELRLEIADARLSWSDADGNELACATKLRLAIQPIILPSREVTHYWLRVDEIIRADGRRAHDIRVEFFDLGEQKMMLELRADWIGLKPTPTHALPPALPPAATNAPVFVP
jgi:hypothetical protein